MLGRSHNISGELKTKKGKDTLYLYLGNTIESQLPLQDSYERITLHYNEGFRGFRRPKLAGFFKDLRYGGLVNKIRNDKYIGTKELEKETAGHL